MANKLGKHDSIEGIRDSILSRVKAKYPNLDRDSLEVKATMQATKWFHPDEKGEPREGAKLFVKHGSDKVGGFFLDIHTNEVFEL
jgi:hypothetical protein